MNWYKQIKDLRIDNDLTQQELANKLNISPKTLARYENGDNEPSISTLIQLALIFNVSLDYIVGIKDTTEINTPSVKEELVELNEKLNKIIRIL